jgi:hypothetical protein
LVHQAGKAGLCPKESLEANGTDLPKFVSAPSAVHRPVNVPGRLPGKAGRYLSFVRKLSG